MHSADSGGGGGCLFNPESFWAYWKTEVGKANPLLLGPTAIWGLPLRFYGLEHLLLNAKFK